MTWHHRESKEVLFHIHLLSPVRSLPVRTQSACHPLCIEHPEWWATYENSIKATVFFQPRHPHVWVFIFCVCACAFSAVTDLSYLLFQRTNTLCTKAVCCAKVLNLEWECIFDQDLCKFHPPTEWICSLALKILFTFVCICVSTRSKAFI